MVEREHQFKIRLSSQEVEWLDELAEQAGVTKTDFLRLLLRRERERVSEPTARVKPKPKRK
jgi:predicted DNA-binding protein